MKIPNYITKEFPNAQFKEAEDWEIEDDQIILDENYSVQIGRFEKYFIADFEEGEGLEWKAKTLGYKTTLKSCIAMILNDRDAKKNRTK